MQLSDREWKAFGALNFFKECCVKNKLNKRQCCVDGKTPVFSSQTENGGILGFTNELPDFHIDTKHSIYILFGDHTKEFRIIENDFSVTDNVKVLVPNLGNKYVVFFIINSWKKAIPDLGYARHWRAAKRCEIMLPVSDTGEPDYQFMEDYIKELMLKKYFQYLI